MNRLLCTCGLAALLALSAFAEPTPTSQQPPVAPAVHAVKKPAAKVDQITSSEDAPAKKPAATPVVTQKAPTVAPSPASKTAEAAPTKPVASPSKIGEAAPAKPAATPSKIVEAAPAKAAATPSKVGETAPAKTVAAPSKIGEAAPAKPVAAPSKIVEATPAKPVAAPSKVVEAAPAVPVAAPSKVVEAAPAKAPPPPARKLGTVEAAPAKGSVVKPAAAAVAPVLDSNLVFPQAKTELKRLMIGNQAGIVKVLGPNREGVSYARGIDDKNIARFTDDACGSIFCALGIPHERLNKVAREIMINYSTLPRKEAVALLGAIAASSHLDHDTDAKAEEFLVGVMETDKDVHARRQSVLALAVKHGVSEHTTEHVLGLFEHSENLWETFPVQQYFEYHASQVRRLHNYPQVRERIAAVKSLYTPAILAALDESKPMTAVPSAGHP